MNLIKKFKIYRHKYVKFQKTNDGIVIENKSNITRYIAFSRLYKKKRDNNCHIQFFGKTITGNEPELKFINKRREAVFNITFNSDCYFDMTTRYFIVAIGIQPNSKIILNELNMEFNADKNKEINSNFIGDTLVVAPGYPSDNNKYLFSFVHTRVLEYQKNKLNVDVAYLHKDNEYNHYYFEDISVNKISYFDLRNLLQVKKYKKIIVHFFNEQVSQILDATDTSNTDLFIFTHGSDILYRDMNLLMAEYFKPISNDSEEQLKFFEFKDEIIRRYNEMPNVKFIFASKWAKARSEEQNKIKFNNYEILPTYIDENKFIYEKKNQDLRKKILIIRKFDNVSTYSIDINVRTILELKKKPFFDDLEFDIYGDGGYHAELLNPIKDLPNVHIYKKFLSHSEMADVYKNHGIALFATRYETQGVSAAEAAMSGVVVVSNKVAAVPEMFGKFDTLAENEDYIQMANIVEKLYKEPKYFAQLSSDMHNTICENYGYNSTMKKEIKMLSEALPKYKFQFSKLPSKKVLTIAVASYNVEKFLNNSIYSLITSKVAEKLEILIVNDGSKDQTGAIAKQLQELTTVGKDSIVKFIDKENGGHGSAINKGIELATGKYFKLMDGDDYFNTKALEQLVEYLEKDESDIILNNYVEDLSVPCKFNVMSLYNFMTPGKEYEIEDLCYDVYGFDKWGPLLSTSTYKTEMLKKADFKISEHCFYVDMELNSIAFSKAKTIKYYPLDIYIYYLGRVGQSVSAASFKRNYKHHERVTLRIISDIYYKLDLTERKKNYLKNKIIVALIKTQYIITTEFLTGGKEFREFDSQLKKYPEFYNNELIINKRLKLFRKTHGRLIKLISLFIRVKDKFRRKKK